MIIHANCADDPNFTKIDFFLSCTISKVSAIGIQLSNIVFMERYKVYFKIKGDDCLNIYHTSATCEQEAIWQWQACFFAKYNECELIGVKLAFPKNNR